MVLKATGRITRDCGMRKIVAPRWGWTSFVCPRTQGDARSSLCPGLACNGAVGPSLRRDLSVLDDASRPYDAYVFPDEEHIKWQPAHRYAIYNRNLDWFRFWLQDYENPAPDKAGQYARWRKLRELQCRNPRALINYCRDTR